MVFIIFLHLQDAIEEDAVERFSENTLDIEEDEEAKESEELAKKLRKRHRRTQKEVMYLMINIKKLSNGKCYV